MKTISNYKSIGGVESCALYPADAVDSVIFSSEGCEVKLSGTPIEVTLLEDASQYEECTTLKHSTTSVLHKLLLVAERVDANQWFENDFVEQAAFEGFVAVISLCDGRRLLAGYSLQLGDEQPLRLESITSTSGTSPHDRPSVSLRLLSQDAEFSVQIL